MENIDDKEKNDTLPNSNDDVLSINNEITSSNINENIDNNNDDNNNIVENNTSNCLALTIKEDYKLTSKTNRILRSLRMSFKVFVSTLTLNIIKFFF